MRELAKQFWENKNVYPKYGFIKERRLYELNYLMPRLSGESLLDIGCGDGALLNCLLHLTDMKLYGCDLSAELLSFVDKRIETQVFDCYEPTPLPQTDISICAGVITYIFEDEVVERFLSNIISPTMYLRATCSMTGESVLFNGLDTRLNEAYASYYRTVDHVEKLLTNSGWSLKDVVRVYPDEIESPYATKQFYFKVQSSNL